MLDSEDLDIFSGRLLYDAEDISPITVVDALSLSSAAQLEADMLRKNAMFGSTEEKARQIEASAKHQNKWTPEFHYYLHNKWLGSGTEALLNGNRAYIRTDVLPAEFNEVALEHEVIEILYKSMAMKNDLERHTSRLGLDQFMESNKGEHCIAILHEVNKAKQQGLLKEYFEYREKRAHLLKQAAKDDKMEIDNIDNEMEIRYYCRSLVEK